MTLCVSVHINVCIYKVNNDDKLFFFIFFSFTFYVTIDDISVICDGTYNVDVAVVKEGLTHCHVRRFGHRLIGFFNLSV